MLRSWSRAVLLLLLATLLCLPIVSVLWFCLHGSAQSSQILAEMARTVLPDYAWTSLALCLMVGLGVSGVGLGTATAVSLFEFKGRRWFEWALLLPLAMPAYVVAYAYTDFLQFSGPLQTALRQHLGLQGRVLPEIRSLGGAALVFTLALYPYVYLLTRAALSERASQLMEAARLLGAPLSRRIRVIALPMARPAIAAGVALALMETLADYGVSSYFGIQTFTAGIYKAWLAMDDRVAAGQLAACLLLVVLVLLGLERRARRHLRFSQNKPDRQDAVATRPTTLKGPGLALAWLVCGAPVLLGFVLPVLFMLRPLLAEPTELPWARFWAWSLNSLQLGLLSAGLAVGLALSLAFVQRQRPDRASRAVTQLVGLGYAIPGAVVVVGLLLPFGWLQQRWPASQAGYWLSATVLGLVLAYLVRFTSVALQTVQSGYTRIPPSLDESARLLGVRGWGLLRRVHAPLLKRSAAAALLLVFVDVMKELPTTLVLRPFNSDTLAVVAYQLARDERLGEAALPSLALVLVGLGPVLLLSRTLRRQGD
ncbi:iron ABC transporter permease [Curvibacter sp. HBC61]|uniref:Iron ABC transporter permease n=1 Tax=Curvibacter cyanobacteriorum TaxID=3026422 RepID=A0ABT5N4Z3_9BURK|nr:iron ABC transporter permease [Curvibacter sp. HBC61]MDD0841123.1 iron ABC transporter permease [Curvibacter sp. HBC61]